MSFRLVPKSVTLNGVMAVTLRYFTEFGKPVFQLHTALICAWPNLWTSLLYFSAFTMSSYRKFTFAISSPDEFLVWLSYCVQISLFSLTFVYVDSCMIFILNK